MLQKAADEQAIGVQAVLSHVHSRTDGLRRLVDDEAWRRDRVLLLWLLLDFLVISASVEQLLIICFNLLFSRGLLSLR